MVLESMAAQPFLVATGQGLVRSILCMLLESIVTGPFLVANGYLDQ